MKHPTLSQIEGRADPHRPGGELRSSDGYYWCDNRVPGTGPRDNPLGQYGGCWCGLPNGHDWPGKNDGDPHPRETRRTAA